MHALRRAGRAGRVEDRDGVAGPTSAASVAPRRLREGLERRLAEVARPAPGRAPRGARARAARARGRRGTRASAPRRSARAARSPCSTCCELRSARRRVERDEDRAEPRAGEPRVDDLEPVLRHDRDAVAVAHAARRRSRRRGARSRRASRRTSASSRRRAGMACRRMPAAWRSSSAGSVRSRGGTRSIRDKLTARPARAWQSSRRAGGSPATRCPPQPLHRLVRLRRRSAARSPRRAAPRARGPRQARRRAPSPRPRRGRRRAACRPTSAVSRDRRPGTAVCR